MIVTLEVLPISPEAMEELNDRLYRIFRMDLSLEEFKAYLAEQNSENDEEGN